MARAERTSRPGREVGSGRDDHARAGPASPAEAKAALLAVQAAARGRRQSDRFELYKAFESLLQSGDPSLTIDLKDSEEELLFENWARAVRGKGERLRLTLRFLRKDPDGLEHYELRIEDPAIRGLVSAKFEDGSWHLKGVGPGMGTPAAPE